MKILVVNCGSSSLKYRLFDMETESELARGLVERIGESHGSRYLYETPAVKLSGAVSAPDDVSVHAARASDAGRLTFVMVNKRAAKPARVTLKLSRPVPAQEVTVYEYSAADAGSIGRLPSRTMSGDSLTVDLPAMSVLRFDLKPQESVGGMAPAR